MQRLGEGQAVLLAVGERLAVCRFAGVADGAAVLVVTDRRRGGPFPRAASDAQLTFEHAGQLVVLNGVLRRGAGEDDVVFSVNDGVQVPSRRANSRARLHLAATVTPAGGAPVATYTTDVSATGIGVRATALGAPGTAVAVEIALPDGTVVAASGRLVRSDGRLSALRLDHFADGGRERLAALVLARQRALVAAWAAQAGSA